LGHKLESGIVAAAQKEGVPVRVQRVGSMLTVFFTKGEVADFASAARSDTQAYARFFHGMLSRKVYLPPAQFEAMFLSVAHSEQDIDLTLLAAREAFQALGKG